MDRPNFFILGAGKAGTTALHSYLGRHPDVLVSQPKEPNFFDAEYERGLGYYWDTYYGAWNGETAAGEARAINLFLPFVAQRIRDCIPDARLIVTLRDPADRAFSHWWMVRSHGIETQSFAAALRTNLETLRTGEEFEGEEGARRWKSLLDPVTLRNPLQLYLELGYYAEQVDRYLRLFPASQMKVVFLDDLRADAKGVVRGLWEFLGVDPDVSLRDLPVVNEGVTRQMRPIMQLARRLGITRRLPKRLVPLALRTARGIGSKPVMDSATRQWLVQHYEPHTRKLEELVDRDLSAWRR